MVDSRHPTILSQAHGGRLLADLLDAGVPAPVLNRALRALHPGLGLTVATARRGAASASWLDLRLPAGEPQPLSRLKSLVQRSRLPAPVRRGVRDVLGALEAASPRGGGSVREPWALLADLVGAVAGLGHLGLAPAIAIARSPTGRLRLTLPELGDWLWVVQTNLDDCPPQVLGYVADRLLAAGARDVTLTPVQMKKGRPGVCLEVLADAAALPAVEALILTETPTLGLRRHRVERRVLPRRLAAVRTRYGWVRMKQALDPRGVWKAMPEYEDCRQAAARAKVPLREVMAAALHKDYGRGA